MVLHWGGCRVVRPCETGRPMKVNPVTMTRPLFFMPLHRQAPPPHARLAIAGAMDVREKIH